MTDEPRAAWLEEMTRRQVLRGAIGGGAALAAGGLLRRLRRQRQRHDDRGGEADGQAAGRRRAARRRDGRRREGHDRRARADGRPGHHAPVWNMYESLAVRSRDFSKLEMLLAESIEPDGRRPDSLDRAAEARDLTFHNGKTVTADDVIFSLQRITDPEGPEGRRGVDRLHRRAGT